MATSRRWAKKAGRLWTISTETFKVLNLKLTGSQIINDRRHTNVLKTMQEISRHFGFESLFNCFSGNLLVHFKHLGSLTTTLGGKAKDVYEDVFVCPDFSFSYK
jgi:hypothetical protein